MSIDEIRSYRNAKPFEPFGIELRDGKTIRVMKPERIAIAPWGRLAIFENSVYHGLHVDEVVAVKVLPPVSKPA